VTLVRRIRVPHRLAGSRLALPVAALFVALAVAPPAGAEKADREKPINFAGDTGDANLQARGGTLAGHVIVTQGTLEIRADRIVFRQNADNSLSATAYGNPVAVRQKRDGVDEYYEGYAQRLEYDGSKELVELFDNALLKRGQDEIRSNYVSYNTATELFKAEGRAGTVPDPAGPGARVRGMFQPKSETPVGGKGKDADKAGAKGGDKAGAKDGDKAGAKDGDKAAAKAAPPAASEPPVVLKPAGELAPPATQ
jgi:lipopolysaccharide export system protein LptA